VTPYAIRGLATLFATTMMRQDLRPQPSATVPMKRFTCERCSHAVYFENVRCEKCQFALGYSSESNAMLSLEPTEQNLWAAVSGKVFRFCANAQFDACNWLISSEAPADRTLCGACAFNRTIPDLSVAENLERWRRLEFAKHRLVYSLQRLRLPVQNGHDQDGGLLFDLLAGYAEDGQEKPVTTGHEDGVITIDVLEGDPAVRIQRRQHLGERFRTLLGHFRHETGHYYLPLLTSSVGVDSFRKLFGDETTDYAAALADYYRDGPRPDWNQHYVTAYASSHPHEDWAETFAHYVHIVDTLETARAYGIGLRSEPDGNAPVEVDVESYSEENFDRLWDLWVPLTVAVNSLNRSMGHDDLYPFVLPSTAIAKLRFVHQCIRESARSATGARSRALHQYPPTTGKTSPMT
jgi:hypothetical protein